MLLSAVNWWYSPSFLNQPPVFVDAAFSRFQTSPNETWNRRQLLQAIGTGDLTCKSSARSSGRNRKQEVQKICWGKNRSLWRFDFEHSHAWYVCITGNPRSRSTSFMFNIFKKEVKEDQVRSPIPLSWPSLPFFRTISTGMCCSSFLAPRHQAVSFIQRSPTWQFPWARTIAW